MASPITDIFAAYQNHLDVDQEIRDEIREIVKSIDVKLREVTTVLQIIHKEEGLAQIPATSEKSKALLVDVKDGYGKLASKIESLSYHRFNDHWKFTSQKATFIVALVHYLETGTLATLEKVTETLGIKSSQADGFHLELDDYLIGVLQLASELSRFAINAVICGDYERPLQISSFVSELSAGFSVLTMKNDYLRKRYDALKYDIKKIEEVVYDLSIRGLKNNPQQ
uniref:Translin n=1 Tax=Cacopsylla melanoneura TaxID=428564 RepID=A0A8D9BDK5_9HEMI